MFTQAWSLDTAQKSSEKFYSPNFLSSTTATALPQSTTSEDLLNSTLGAIFGAKYYFCGRYKHPHQICPTKEAICIKCQIKGHFVNVCTSNPASPQSGSGSAAAMCSTLAAANSYSLSSLSNSSTEF